MGENLKDDEFTENVSPENGHSKFRPELLVVQINAGNQKAEAELIKRFTDSLRFVLWSNFGDSELVQDVSQETFRYCILLS